MRCETLKKMKTVPGSAQELFKLPEPWDKEFKDRPLMTKEEVAAELKSSIPIQTARRVVRKPRIAAGKK